MTKWREIYESLPYLQLIVYASSELTLRPKIILGTEFRFVRCKRDALFGITEMWIEKSEKVSVSDLERTILDGLKQPKYCGGISEVAKGIFIKQSSIDYQKLVDYALRLDIGAVMRRLGFLLELYNIGSVTDRVRLQAKLSGTYHLFDPDLSAEGNYLANWRLKLNVPQEELLAIRGT